MAIRKVSRHSNLSKGAARSRQTNRNLVVETLEDRRLLDGNWLTVIAHGQTASAADDWVGRIATSVQSEVNRAFSVSDTVDLDLSQVALTRDDDVSAIRDRAHEEVSQHLNDRVNQPNNVLLLDWPEARDIGFISAPGAADEIGARLGLLVGHILKDLPRIDGVHLIGHSRGSYVVTTAAAILTGRHNDPSVKFGMQLNTEHVIRDFIASEGPGIRQPDTLCVTTLDPQSYGSDGELKLWGANYWENYYQTESIVEGKNCPGANFNVDITDSSFRENAARWLGVAESHAAVHDWYAEAILSENRNSSYLWNETKVGGTEVENAEQKHFFLPALGQAGVSPPNKAWAMVAGVVDDNGRGQDEGDGYDDHVSSFGSTATFVGHGVNVPGNIGSSVDHDWFQYTSPSDGSVTIEVIPQDARLRPYVRFHWDNKILIGHDTAGGLGNSAQVSYGGAEAGRTYFIDVSGAAGSTGSYVIRISPEFRDDPADHVPPNAPAGDDFPNSLGDARSIAVDGAGTGAVSGVIEQVGDSDWFTFTTKKDGPLAIRVETPNSSLDTHLRLHNSAVLLQQGHSYLQRTANAGETYWLHVRAGGENGPDDIGPGEDPTGRYRVVISQPSSLGGGSGPAHLPELNGALGATITLDGNGDGVSSGSIDEAVEEDWFVVRNVHGGNMLVAVDGVNDDLKEFVTAFRSDFGGIDTDSGEFDVDARVGFQVADNETILVRVTSAGGRYTGGYNVTISQPDNLPDDDVPDFGESPLDISSEMTQEGDGSVNARIETPDDNDWYKIPFRGSGFVTVEVVAADSTLIPFLELNRDGTSGGFFETDDGRDGRANVSFLHEPGATHVWVKVSSVDETRGRYTLNTWRSENPDDDYPDGGGVFLQPRQLPADGQLFIYGTIEYPGDSDNFHVRLDQPGPVAVQYIPLTEGFDPFFSRARQHVDPNQWTGTSGGGSGRGGRAYEVMPDMMAAPDNWLVIDVKRGGRSVVPSGDYVVHVRQAGSATDIDADTVGVEASPILLDGTGNGSLPGAPNDTEPVPALDHAGDVDVFQVVAAADRPMTFTVSGQDTFLRLYDAGGRAIITDDGSGPGGASQITVEANRGDLLYLEVAASNGTDTGDYSIGISQPTDDHPDTPIFQPQEGQIRDATPIVVGTELLASGVYPIGLTLDLQSETMYWMDHVNAKIQRSNLDGAGSEVLVTTGPAYLKDISLDTVHGKMYWTESNLGRIRRANLDGTEVEDVVTGLGHPSGIALDAASGLFYWTDYGTQKIQRASLDGTGVQDLLSVGLVEPVDIVLDLAAGKMYWTDTVKRTVERADLDGSAAEILVANSDGPSGLDLDLAAGKIYWTSFGPGTIQRSNLDGTDVEQILSGLGDPYRIALDPTAGRMYWTDYAEQKIQRTHLDYSDVGFGPGQIADVGDRDVFQIHASGRGQFTVDVVTTDDTLDTFLRVYDSRGNLVGIDDDGGDGRNSRVTFATFMDETYFLEVAGYGDNSVGAYAVTVQESPPLTVEKLGTFDTFGGLDSTRWSLTYSGKSNLGVGGGKVRLEAFGDGASIQNNSTTLASRAFVNDAVSFDLAGAFGRDHNYGYVQVTDGTNFIQVQMNRLSDDGSNDVIVSSLGYTELENNGPVAFAENTTYRFSIETVGSEIHVLMDGTILARYDGAVLPQSFLRAVSRSAADGGREALLTLDNVAGNFLISDPLPFEIPATTTTTTGLYDDFEDASLDGGKWAVATAGVSEVEESEGVLRLSADGPGSPTDDNRASVESLGVVQGDVEFDLTANLGLENNSAFTEVTNGSEYIRLLLDSDGVGGVVMSVESNGYTELENTGPQPATEGQTYHVSILQTSGTIEVYSDAVRLARFAGPLRINSVLQSDAHSDASPAIEQWELYDDFGQYPGGQGEPDSARWQQYNGGSGDVQVSSNRLELRAGAGNPARVKTDGKTNGNGWVGAEFDMFKIGGGSEGEVRDSSYVVGLNEGVDGIRISMFLQNDTSFIRGRGKFADLRVDVSGRNHHWQIVKEGPDTKIYADGVLKATQAGATFGTSAYFYAEAKPPAEAGSNIGGKFGIDNLVRQTVGEPGADEQARFAQLTVDNVTGIFQMSTDAVVEPYDDFNDGQVDFDKWRVSGTVEEREGALKLVMFRNSEPLYGYATTAGVPGGMNLRGFKLGFSRTTEPRSLGTWDIHTRFELTNGQDWIRIGGLHKQTFFAETGGGYGSRRVDVSVPSGQIPDGPFEVREWNGNIEVLHNNNVKLTVPNQTVRAGSYFTFQAHGNPHGQSTRDEPQNFDAFIDNVYFYVEPVTPDVRLAPTMKQASDSGMSNSDHVTKELSVDFEWARGPAGTQYQWREGELLPDGTIDFGTWSDVRDGTTTRVDLPHASVHVFSVRPVSLDGIVGPESSRGFIVDVDGPRVVGHSLDNLATTPDSLSAITFYFNESVDPSTFTLDDVVAFNGPGGDLRDQLLDVTGVGDAFTVTMNVQTVPGIYQMTLGPDILDVAGNAMDQDADGTDGEPTDDQYQTTALTVEPAVLAVEDFLSLPSGFQVRFNRSPDFDVLNLYDYQQGGQWQLGPADVTLVHHLPGGVTEPVAGSLVIDTDTVTFIATGGPLAMTDPLEPDDYYSVTLRSAVNGFRDLANRDLLDGDSDGNPGGDFVHDFTVDAVQPVVVSLPDFTRGPGQLVEVPAASAGLPIRLSQANGVESVQVVIEYNPALLNISGALLGADAPAGSFITINSLAPGFVSLTFDTDGVSLSAGPAEIVTLTAEVPLDVPYGAAHVVAITSVDINENGVLATADAALHVAAFFGDTTGNGDYSGLDAQRVARVTVDLDNGFEPYATVDPLIIADVTGNGSLSGLDAQRIARKAVGLDATEIPSLPQPLRLDEPPSPLPMSNVLANGQLTPVVRTALERITSANGDDLAMVQGVTLEIADLPGDLLGLTRGSTIQIDVNAAGYGWFIDTTPWDDAEFTATRDGSEMVALVDTAAHNRVDLLTVVLHELGHVLGADHSDQGIMDESLPMGTRRVRDDESYLDDLGEFTSVLDAAGLVPATVDNFFATV